MNKYKYRAEDLEDYVEEKNGHLWTDCRKISLMRARDVVKVQCDKGHIWEPTVFSLLKKRSWCQKCKLREKRYTADEIKAKAFEKEFRIDNPEDYNGISINNLKFKHLLCGTHFIKNLYFLLKGNARCPNCQNPYIQPVMEDGELFAKQKGGRIVDWNPRATGKSKWECKNGHVWNASWARMKKNGYWCGKCARKFSKSKQEDVVRLCKKALNGYRYRDKVKKRECDIDLDFMVDMRTKPCVYCDRESTGVDRIDNSLGHIKDNCVPCCVRCNWVRGSWLAYDTMIEVGKVLKRVDP